MKRRTESGEMANPDVIRQIMREHSSRENPLGITAISRYAKNMGYSIGRNAIEGFMIKMNVKPYVTEEELEELLQGCSSDLREVYFCKTSPEMRRTRGYWVLEALSDSEWMYLIDSVIYSKILTKKEADNLAKRVTLLAGKKVSELMEYRCRMEKQPYFVGDDDIDEKVGHIESQVLKQVRLIREAIGQKKKIKFNLNVYRIIEFKKQYEVKLVPYGKFGRICSPYEVIYSNGRYYMLAADEDTERRDDIKYKLYRIDLMSEIVITRVLAKNKEEAGINELRSLYRYRVENPYMFAGKVERVRIRVDSDQLTQIVDWFGDAGEPGRDSWTWIGNNMEGDENECYDIELKVNLNSFTFWVLQYSGCVEVLDTGKKGDESYRKHIKETLSKALEKYEEDDKWR